MSEKKVGKRLLTWVLVLVMTLSLLPLNVLAANGPETDSSSGMIFTKELLPDQPDDDGNYTIRMTAQATGKTTTTDKAVPMDIVLVLDQSGSMKDSFGDGTRQSAMKEAVNSFIGEVARKHTQDADHHMAIVTFGSDATELAGWTEVDPAGKSELEQAINALPSNPEGATNVGDGMELAQTLMNSSKAGADRQKTVIVFTDGVPTKQSDFDTTVANTAISAAKDMKDDDVTIYTVGIFNGANPDEMYGASGFDKDSDGTIGSEWKKETWGLFPGTDFPETDRPAGNRFLNLVSSNYLDASSIGLNCKRSGLGIFHYKITYKITENFNRDSSDYYKTAGSALSLNGIFKTISDTIVEPDNAELNANTVITDMLSNYFTFATGTADGDVKVYAGQRELTNGEDITVDLNPTTKTVTVTGYDFSEHYTNSNDPEKLVIEIKVKPSGEGYTSKDIPTNADTTGTHAARVEVEVKSEDGTGTETKVVTSHETAKVTGHNVIYELAGGKGPITGDGLYYPQNAAVPVTNSVPTRDGYEFTGWTSDIESDDKVYTYNGDNSSITMPAANVTLTAQWEEKNDAGYTVHYYKQGTTDSVASDKVVNNAEFGKEYTENAVSVTGYTPVDPTSQNVTADYSKKEITFYYTVNNDAGYTVHYYKQGTTDKVKDDKVVNDAEYNKSYTENAASVTGYTPVDPTSQNVTADYSKKEITFYYTVNNDAGYTVHYYKQGTTDSLASDKVVNNAEFGKEYTENAVSVTGYTAVDPTSQNVTADYNKKEITFYYGKADPTPGTFDFNDVDHSDDKATPAITKTVKGNVGRNFKETFAVTVKGTDEKSKATMSAASYTGKAEVTYSDLKDIAFQFAATDKLTFHNEGNYIYTVREIPGTTSRMSYDTTEYTLKINVVLDADSNTYKVESWQFTAGNREYPAALNIVNTYRTNHPSTPSKPTVEIPDDDALGLNTTDHFAYIVGYGNGEVRPQNNITRAEVATIFFRLLTDDVRDENLTKTNRYSDVAATSWYNTAVSTLSSMGIITGYPDGTFRPNAAITRAEFAAIAARFDNDGDKTAAKFSDIATHWAKDEISIAYNNGWITGYPDGTFGPQRDITRAETMTLVNRVLNRQPETEDDLLPNMTVWTDNANPKAWYYLAVQEATNSHYYEFKTNSQYEKWTELRETRDWTQLEK